VEDIIIEVLPVDFDFVRHNRNHFLFVVIEEVDDLFFDLQLTQIPQNEILSIVEFWLTELQLFLHLHPLRIDLVVIVSHKEILAKPFSVGTVDLKERFYKIYFPFHGFLN